MRRKLRRYGTYDEAELKQPLAEMQLEKAFKLRLNWLTLNIKRGDQIELRVVVPEERMAYEGKLRLCKERLHVSYVQAKPELIGKILHKWDPQVTYETLTKEEILNSISRANMINTIKEYRKTMRGDIDDITKRQLKRYLESRNKPTTTATVDEEPIKLPRLTE